MKGSNYFNKIVAIEFKDALRARMGGVDKISLRAFRIDSLSRKRGCSKTEKVNKLAKACDPVRKFLGGAFGDTATVFNTEMIST